MDQNQPYSFQVNLQGMISLLSEHLYSNPNTFIRELLQNGVDAITARRNLEESLIGKIKIQLPTDEDAFFTFQDNGIGLKESEIHQFLSVIGESSKRNDNIDTKDFIGKFGIGMLSCFVVSEKIIVETQSIFEEQSFRWTASSDGNYTIENLPRNENFGTKVILYPKSQYKHLFNLNQFLPQIRYYGNALTEEITIENESEPIIVNETKAQWINGNLEKEDLLQIGRDIFNIKFLDAVPFHTKAGDCSGVFYILPQKTSFTGKQNHRIFLKRMFLTENDNGLLPSWAFFVKMLINSNDLNATASRESLMHNDALREVKKEIGDIIKHYLEGLKSIEPEIYYKIMQVHFLHVKAIALEDAEFLQLVKNDLPFETSKGFRSFGNIIESGETIYYCPDFDEFKQVQRLANFQGNMVINASYTFDEDLLKKIASAHPEYKIQAINSYKLLNSLQSIDEKEEISLLEIRTKILEILKNYNLELEFKRFQPADTPTLYTRPEESAFNNTIKQLKENSNPFASAIQSMPQERQKKPVFCLNLDNSLIQNLITITDTDILTPIVQVLFVQAMLMGKYTVSEKELTMFNDALYSLIVMGMTNFINI